MAGTDPTGGRCHGRRRFNGRRRSHGRHKSHGRTPSVNADRGRCSSGCKPLPTLETHPGTEPRRAVEDVDEVVRTGMPRVAQTPELGELLAMADDVHGALVLARDLEERNSPPESRPGDASSPKTESEGGAPAQQVANQSTQQAVKETQRRPPQACPSGRAGNLEALWTICLTAELTAPTHEVASSTAFRKPGLHVRLRLPRPERPHPHRGPARGRSKQEPMRANLPNPLCHETTQEPRDTPRRRRTGFLHEIAPCTTRPWRWRSRTWSRQRRPYNLWSRPSCWRSRQGVAHEPRGHVRLRTGGSRSGRSSGEEHTEHEPQSHGPKHAKLTANAAKKDKCTRRTPDTCQRRYVQRDPLLPSVMWKRS